jgi:hypothetical protein
MDNYFSSPDLFDDLTKHRKSTVAEQYDKRERECRLTCYHQINDWNVAIFVPGQEMTRRQWSREISVTCVYWQICTIHHQRKVTFVTNMETLWSHRLYRTTTSTWGTLTEWPPATQSNGGYGSGPKNYFFTCWTWLSWTASSSWHHVVPKRHRNFRLALVRNLIENAGSLPRPRRPIGRPAAVEKKVTRLEVNFSSHWPIHSSRVNCRTCSTRGIRKRVQVKCKECNVGLCTGECFEVYYKKYKLWCIQDCW